MDYGQLLKHRGTKTEGGRTERVWKRRRRRREGSRSSQLKEQGLALCVSDNTGRTGEGRLEKGGEEREERGRIG